MFHREGGGYSGMNSKTVIVTICLLVIFSLLSILEVESQVSDPESGQTTDQQAVNESKGQDWEPPKLKEPLPHHPGKVTVYYFHGSARCRTCRNMESYADEVVKGEFEEEMKDGRLEWLTVNIDESDNEHFVTDYQLFTRSLVLVKTSNGEEVSWKNLDQIWKLAGDKGAYKIYVQNEIKTYLEAE
jgi:hypothetical protein